MSELIEELGGPNEAARRLHRRGTSPMRLALEILGLTEAARAIGVSRQAMHNLARRKPVGDWPARYVKSISEATKIPVDTLLLDPGVAMPARTNGEVPA